MATTEQLKEALARNVRALRSDRDWSLAELATRSGVSRAMIVQVEGGRTNASLGTMCQLADALGVPVTTLIEGPERASMRVIPAAETSLIWSERGSTARLLTGLSSPENLEVWEWRLGAGGKYESKAHPAGTWEIIWVHRGTLELKVASRAVAIGAGDCVTFEARERHTYRNPRADPCEFAMVVHLPASTAARRPLTSRKRS